MIDELPDLNQVVMCKLLHIVMSSSIHIVRRVLYLAGSEEFLSMVERHDFISAAVNYEDWTVNVGHAIDIGELVKGQSEAQVEDYSQS